MLQKQWYFLIFSVKVVWKRWWFRKIHPIFGTCSVLFRECYLVLFLYFVMTAAGSLHGWTFYEVLLCQSFLSLSYGVLLLFFSGLRDFRLIGKRRKLDVALLRPKGVLLQVLLEDTDWFAMAAHSILGIGLLAVSLRQCRISVTLEIILQLLCNLTGAVLIQAAMWLYMAALECFIGKTTYIKRILFWIPRNLLRLPLHIYPAALRYYCIYAAPFAFVSYFPVLNLLGRTDPLYPCWFGRLSLPLGIFLYLGAYGCWRLGLVRYRNTGGA